TSQMAALNRRPWFLLQLMSNWPGATRAQLFHRNLFDRRISDLGDGVRLGCWFNAVEAVKIPTHSRCISDAIKPAGIRLPGRGARWAEQ
ncbi:MAG: hypothetical protein O6934_09725, partial [SAR324 cluster bacterium]|nr:hypothetical protein [SAR324 cluster bacterium]